jgi:hypothetical protein
MSTKEIADERNQECPNKFCTDGWVDKARSTPDGGEYWVEQVACRVCAVHCDDDTEAEDEQ